MQGIHMNISLIERLVFPSGSEEVSNVLNTTARFVFFQQQ
jgi:hypothetical protein